MRIPRRPTSTRACGVREQRTNGGSNNNFGIRGTAPAREPELERENSENLSWMKGRATISRPAFWLHFCQNASKLNTFQTYTFSEQSRRANRALTTPGLSLASALARLHKGFTAHLPILHGGTVCRFAYDAWAGYLQGDGSFAHRDVIAGIRYDHANPAANMDGRALWNSLDLTTSRNLGATNNATRCAA